ncbi:DNA polymerase III subunit alpha [Candidatus Uhrbacteria bacterium RIFOXYC2_FULL_47_19]|uniref:DNA polymerase III subunit alpha n=1 Tax=Candidatus Uhrbacteria bacterium RIFOXYC2_FULL_47_19 TaxID=1802424 RepID=A0A1F7WEF8_9BACT|nr:MAG: DNA polymerase III subunit alpha [Candidatus Uhrbacteria bacterium RIFOXYC2_FULL_47_19]
MTSRFVHLHVHSHYSMLRALPQIKALVKSAKDLSMDAVALTDYGAMYGGVEFYQACLKQEIKPIIGLCAYVALDRLTDKRPRIDDQNYQLVLLAENLEGYRNLLQLATIASVDGFYYRPRIDKEVLRKHSAGLIGLSGGLSGEINKALNLDDWMRAERVAREYADIFGPNNFFLEMQDHPELDEQNARNTDLRKLAIKTNLPLVATKDVHYLQPDDAEAHDVLMCVGAGKTVQDDRRKTMTNADYSFVSGEHMEKAFADVPEAIENTRRIADRCNIELDLGKWYFADFKIPEGKTYDEQLREETIKGIDEKFPEVTDVIRERMEYELDVIKTKGYASYFLIVSDYMRFAKKQGIAATTRGSAAGSLVSYAIDIVPVNPLTYNLPFERFLNPMRPSAPDIDGDFEDSRRDEMIAYVTEKYGHDKVAQIGTYGTLAARGAVRDVGRALGLPYAFCDRVAKLVPMGSQGFPMTIARALEDEPELKELHDTDPQVRKLLGLAQKVEGCARHCSVHAAGVVIAPRPLTEYTALQKETGGEKLITQYDMHQVESAGVVKMDFLGIRNLSILGLAVKTIRKTKGINIDIYDIPLDDPKTYSLLKRGDTTGLFQLGGSGMTKYLTQLEPTTVTDIMAMVALYRPGPIESIPEFIRRKHDPSAIDYPDPRLKEALEASYGLLVYQDDVMLTAITLAGYDWLEADKLRKAMGKKIPAEMARQKDKFITGCQEFGGLSEVKAWELWRLIEPFAAYGFNKAHACSYGMVAYQTAYLKANWTAEYMAALLTCESHDLDEVAVIVQECERLGIKVLPPSINESLVDFTFIDDQTVRFGLRAIKNVGIDVARAIIDERKSDGVYRSISDMASRVETKNFNKRVLESLIKAGAMDCLGERNQFLASLDQILQFNRNAMKDAASGQGNLFALAPVMGHEASVALREVPPATKREKLAWERELLGLYVSEHPFTEYAQMFKGLLTPIADIRGQKGQNGLFRVAGNLSDVREILTKKKQEPMAFAKLDDGSGEVEVVVFPRTYGESKACWVKDQPVLVEGKYDERDGDPKVICEKATMLSPENASDVRDMLTMGGRKASVVDATMTMTAEQVLVQVPPTMAPSIAQELKRIFEKHPGGRRVVLIVEDGGSEKRIETSFRVAVSSDLIVSVERLFGRGVVRG